MYVSWRKEMGVGDTTAARSRALGRHHGSCRASSRARPILRNVRRPLSYRLGGGIGENPNMKPSTQGIVTPPIFPIFQSLEDFLDHLMLHLQNGILIVLHQAAQIPSMMLLLKVCGSL